MNKSCFSIRARAPKAEGAASSAEVFIYGDIGQSWWDESVTAADFVKEISALDVDKLAVRINSVGGSVPDGLAIYNALKRHRASVTVSIDGMAMSIASLIAMAGDTIEMADNAMLMIHAPWTYAAGNAVQLRDQADVLDKWATAMSTSYAAKTGREASEMLALLTDGEDHYYTAAEAKEEGLVDVVVDALPLAASIDMSAALARFKNPPAAMVRRATAAPSAQSKENQMPGTTQQTDDNKPSAKQVDAAAVLAQDKVRREGIRAGAQKFIKDEAVAKLVRECEDDISCTVAMANEKLLAHLGAQASPVAGGVVVTVEDERDKAIAASVDAIMVRGTVAKADVVKAINSNPYRGMKMLDFARASLQRAKVDTRGMDQMQIVAAAFTQSGSDFPILLENVMHKTLQQAYAVAPDTWSRFCAIGTVSDFRDHPRYRTGSLGNLDKVNELGEFKSKTIPDGEKGKIAAETVGNIINLSRKVIVNDDLGAFVALAAQLGRAARRTIEATVYARLAENSGAGPTLEDGKALFHADHGNVLTGAVPSVDAFETARVAMALQKDVGGNDFLDLRPAIWLGPMGIGGDARVINGAEYDPDTPNKLQKTNKVRGLVRDIVDTPRLSGNGWYFFADPVEAPVLEVAFLDGNQEPFLELQNGFDVDGARWKARLDFGVAGIDFRGAQRNPGQ